MYTYTPAAPRLTVNMAADIPTQVLDFPPFNGFSLSCTAATNGFEDRTALTKAFTWTRSISGGPHEDLISDNDEVSIVSTDLHQETTTSVLTINTTQGGSHVYTCAVILVVTPAEDNIQRQAQQTVNVQGTYVCMSSDSFLQQHDTHLQLYTPIS